MPVRWTSIEIMKPQPQADAEAVFLSGSPLLCLGSAASCVKVLDVIERIEFDSDAHRTLDLLPGADRLQRVLVIVTGEPVTGHEQQWLSIGGRLAEAMEKYRLRTVRLPDSTTFGGSDALEAVLLGALLHSFRREKATGIESTGRVSRGLIVAETDVASVEHVCCRANAVNRARAWVEEPANFLTPPAWVDEIAEVFARPDVVVQVLNPTDLTQIGAGALLAVGRGSEHGPRLLVVEWRGSAARGQWDAVLVGKGLTFDGGGLNLKPRPTISKMKLDMAAGAAVLGALELAIARQSCANVVAIVPMAENAIDARAYRPGDVITSHSGITIEVADTDAEGRLVLADALTYGIRNYNPTWIIDAATLTMAVVRVLHEEFAAIYTSDDHLARQLIAAGEAVGERLWRMPLDSSQDYLIESEVADVCNVGAAGFFGVGTGSPAAGAKFLAAFTGRARWAHIDMTGTAWSTRRTSRCGKGATGYGVRLLDRWLAMLEKDFA